MQDNAPRDRISAARFGTITALVMVAVAAGWAGANLLPASFSAVSAADRKSIETVVRDYLLENPEVLPEAMEALQRKDDARQLASISDEVHTPYPGAVLGNPRGTVTLVEFSDFACGYCRKSVADIETLIAENRDLKVIVRELPILSEHSVEAARMALAAAEQGKFAEFHSAMFAAGQPGPETIAMAASKAGLNMARARTAAASPRIQEELDRNVAFAQQLGFSGTPSWIAGDRLIGGAVGADELSKALEASGG